MTPTEHGRTLEQDRNFSWHPFTQMSEWMASDPIVINSGFGAYLYDAEGNAYLDANASIWTNLHGHHHPTMNQAIIQQLDKVAHISYLGLAHQPGSELASELAALQGVSQPDDQKLQRVFFSDDGSTAVEAGLKMVYEAAKRKKGMRNPGFISLDSAYHGDSIGAVSLGQVGIFHQSFQGLLFPVDKFMNPYCYRCPFNRGKPEPGISSIHWKKCHWECVDQFQSACEMRLRQTDEAYAAVVIEPEIQGVAGMVSQPQGWLEKISMIARQQNSWLVFDEVMTGFGRTGPDFAWQNSGMMPDILCLAKGLTGGYLPLAATLATQEIFSAFLGEYQDQKTFFHGHSYTANPLACAAALESLQLLRSTHTQSHREMLSQLLKDALNPLWDHPNVGDIRQSGTIAGIEIVRNRSQKTPFHWKEKAGIRVCHRLSELGVLTRPIGNIIVVMLPYCANQADYQKLSSALVQALHEFSSATQLNHFNG